jgi:NodT family efflux transporter outer membrane factor (OMF) lipoprotein
MSKYHASRALPFTVLLAALSGCAWFGEETRRAEMIAMPSMGRTLSAARGSLPADGKWPEQAWWQMFGNAELNRLIEAAVADNPGFKAAEARLRQSQAMVDAQAAELYPTVDANVTFTAQRFSANSTEAKLAGEHFRKLVINPFILRYHLDFWGQDKAALDAAVGQALAARAELADARLLLSVAVASSYFDLLAAAEKLNMIKEIVAYRENLMKLEQVRVDTGLAATTPLLYTQVQLGAVREIEAAVRAEVELQKNLLATLAGKGPDWGRDIGIKRGVFPKRLALPGNLPLHLLAHRPDVTAARLKAEAAAQEIKVAKTAFYPDVNLIAFAGLHSVDMSDVILQGSSLAYAVGPSIDLPIFEGGRLRANLSYKEAAYDVAVERYNNSLLHAVQEVADALTRWRDIEARLAEQRQTVDTIAETSRLTETLNRTGLSNRSESLEASAVEYEQRFRLAVLEGEHLKAAVQVIKALGGGYVDTKEH